MALCRYRSGLSLAPENLECYETSRLNFTPDLPNLCVIRLENDETINDDAVCEEAYGRLGALVDYEYMTLRMKVLITVKGQPKRGILTNGCTWRVFCLTANAVPYIRKR